MTPYSAVYSASSINADQNNVTNDFALRAGDFPVRIMSVAVVGYSGLLRAPMSRIDTSPTAIGGGSTLVPSPLRDGSDPASATVRYRPCVRTDTGTGSYTMTQGSAVTYTGSGTTRLIDLLSYTGQVWEPPDALTLYPGSVLRIQALLNEASTSSPGNISFSLVKVYFDEERVVRAI